MLNKHRWMNGNWKILTPLLSLMFVGISNLHPAFASWSQETSWGSDDSPSNSASYHSMRSHDLTKDVTPYSPGSNNLALDLGQVFLLGDLGNKYSDSIGTQVHYGYGSSRLFAFDSSFGYSQHSNGALSMLSLLAGLRMNMNWYDKIVPYFVFGMGFYKPSYSDSTVSPQGPQANNSSVSAVLFGMHFGGGVDLELSKNLYFGADLTFHSMFGTTGTLNNGSTMDIGGTYTSFLIHLGTTF